MLPVPRSAVGLGVVNGRPSNASRALQRCSAVPTRSCRPYWTPRGERRPGCEFIPQGRDYAGQGLAMWFEAPTNSDRHLVQLRPTPIRSELKPGAAAKPRPHVPPVELVPVARTVTVKSSSATSTSPRAQRFTATSSTIRGRRHPRRASRVAIQRNGERVYFRGLTLKGPSATRPHSPDGGRVIEDTTSAVVRTRDGRGPGLAPASRRWPTETLERSPSRTDPRPAL